jgi:hypothetical protein
MKLSLEMGLCIENRSKTAKIGASFQCHPIRRADSWSSDLESSPFLFRSSLLNSSLNVTMISVDRNAPRKPRPSGRGLGELYKIKRNPYREAPPFRAGSFSCVTIQPFIVDLVEKKEKSVQKSNNSLAKCHRIMFILLKKSLKKLC